MFIIPLPWNRTNLQNLADESDLFDLVMNYSTQQCYLIIQDDAVTWIGQGTVPGRVAYQIMSRTAIIGERVSLPHNHGNVGFLGKYSSIEDAVLKVFPRKGHCVSGMSFGPYSGQKLRGKKEHYSVIEPILCLFDDQPSARLRWFFNVLGWGSRKRFDCLGTWNDLTLLIDGHRVSSLEEWFINYCNIAL